MTFILRRIAATGSRRSRLGVLAMACLLGMNLSCEVLDFVAPLGEGITSLSPAEWNALMLVVDSNLTVPATYVRKCNDCPDSTMTVELAAVRDSYRVGGDSTPEFGAVVARVVNTTTSTGHENYYGLPDGRYAFLLVVTRPTSTAPNGEWTLAQFDWTPGPGGIRTYSYKAKLTSGRFDACAHKKTGSTANAAFATCDEASSLAPHPGGALMVLAPSATSPIWVRCVAGCCTATRNSF
jgi:hypothetical protein